MSYTLDDVHYTLQQFADKVESDYFTLPELLSHFRVAANNFVAKRLDDVEKTQQITDDILPLITPGSLDVILDPDDNTRYIAALPARYLRLLSYDIIYDDGTKCRRADKIRQAEHSTASNNPFRRGSKFYPNILQENNLLHIDAGPAIPQTVSIKFAKKPVIAKAHQKTTRIINLPDEAVDKIILDTVTRLFNRTADQRTQSNYQLEQTFKQFISK